MFIVGAYYALFCLSVNNLAYTPKLKVIMAQKLCYLFSNLLISCNDM